MAPSESQAPAIDLTCLEPCEKLFPRLLELYRSGRVEQVITALSGQDDSHKDTRRFLETFPQRLHDLLDQQRTMLQSVLATYPDHRETLKEFLPFLEDKK